MTAVGSPLWAARTNGSLRVRAQMRFALAAVARELAALSAATRHRRRVGSVLDADRIPPDTHLARAIQDVAASELPAPLFGHSLRTWIWGGMLAELDGVAYDDEALYVAALLHDLGLAPGHRPSPESSCFAVHGATQARTLLRDAGAGLELAEQVADAIVAHFNVSVPLSWGAEAHLLHGGAHLDVVGRRLGEIAPETVAGVLEWAPRTGFAGCFTAAMRLEAALRPSLASGAALAARHGADDPSRIVPGGHRGERVRTAALGLLGVVFTGLGLWAGIDSGSFNQVLADFGPRNDHLVHDFGAATVAIGVGLLIATRRLAWQPPVLLVATIWNGLHAVSHVVDIDAAASRGLAIAEAALLVAGTALLAALTVASKEDA